MAHLHSVYDTDNHFSINPITRAIRNEATEKTSLVQHDHDSERFTFELPRFVEGHDMSLCDKVEVHYINIGKDGKSEDVYIVDDVSTSPEDDSVVIFSWLISGNATKYAGSLHFLIRFVCLDGDNIEYAWHTAIYSDITIADGMNNGEAVITEYSDVLEAWKQEIFADFSIALETERNAAVAEIEAKGAETLATIPEDYTKLVEKVNRTTKRTTNLEHCIVSDSKVTYSSVTDYCDVPEGVAPYAEVNMIGGMTYRDSDTNTLYNMKVLSVDSYDNDANSVGSIAIPEAVQALEGYGSGIDAKHCNRIEWDEDGTCHFVTAVVRKTFVGEYREGWTYSPLGSNDIGDNQFCRCKIGDLGLAIDEAIVSNRFDQAYIGSSTTDVGVNIINSSAYGNCGVYIRIPGMTSIYDYLAQLSAWAAEGNPLTVEFALAVPIYEEIGDLITVDNYLKVVEGGYIRFYAENNETVPSKVTFTRKGTTVDVSEVGV